jgi:hypothetical protein
MKKLILAGLVIAGALGAVQVSAPKADANVDCSLVRCMECPAGTVWAPKPNDCCRCVPVN